ncbi:MAG: cysteine-rich CWC family protein [Oligoflexus sp.]
MTIQRVYILSNLSLIVLCMPGLRDRGFELELRSYVWESNRLVRIITMTVHRPPNDPGTLCPLCGQGNNCHPANGKISPCWCRQESFPKDLLAKVPSQDQGCVCICRACVEQHQKGNS